MSLELAPQPLRQGPVTATVALSGADGRPLPGAEVRLEGNMSHAGMKPVFGVGREVRPGVYESPLELTMGGDWYVIVTARLAQGGTVERQIPVPGVLPR